MYQPLETEDNTDFHTFNGHHIQFVKRLVTPTNDEVSPYWNILVFVDAESPKLITDDRGDEEEVMADALIKTITRIITS